MSASPTCPRAGLLVLLASCTGTIGGPAEDEPVDGMSSSTPAGAGARATGAPGVGPAGASGAGSTSLPARELAASSAFRRLTADEYDNTVRDLLGETARASRLILPDDQRHPFDNDYTLQIASKALIEGTELLARDVSARLLADAPRRDKVVGCRPASATDVACLREFVTRFGRRALRRPLAEAEIQRFVALSALAQSEGDFYAAVDAVLRAFLQDGEFLYRVEIGTPVSGAPGLVKLGDWEIASRLSYFVIGSMPTDALLDWAERGRLRTPEDVRAAATELLGDRRARDRVARFHAMWMGFETLPHAAPFAGAMKEETNALLERVIFDDRRPWQDLFRFDQTFVSDVLAKPYGLPAPGPKPVWVPYGNVGRRGIMSHGTFLSLGEKNRDTDPVRRGKLIRESIFCQEIPPPPPEVDTAIPPSAKESPCKWDKYAMHRQGACAGCHRLMDPVGFGLESFDASGRFRQYDVDATGKPLTQCPIRGDGEVADVGTFNGPVGLQDLLLRSGLLNGCAATQLYRFAIGRFQLDETDRQLIGQMARRLGDKDFRLDELLLDFVSSSAFAHRRVEK